MSIGIPGLRQNVSAAPIVTPLTILGAKLLQWCRADLGVTIGTGVSAWADQSGNPNHYLQGTGAAQPSWGATAGPNGTPGITFDGSNDILQCGGFNLPAPGTTPTYMSFILQQATWNGASGVGIATGIDATVGFQKLGFFQVGSTPSVRMNNPTNGNLTFALTVATWKRCALTFLNTTADSLKIGSSVTTGINSGNNVSAGRTLGGGTVFGATFSNIIVADLIYSQLPSAQELIDLDAYFTARYGAGLT